jgi:endonuclease YncB( thermonuclease family)
MRAERFHRDDRIAIGDGLQVLDGDDIEWQGKHYRLDGYDAPQTWNLRSRTDKRLERTRGLKARHRLASLLKAASQVHIIPFEDELPQGSRGKAALLIDGWDVSLLAMRERWGCAYEDRMQVDWGNADAAFDDDLPAG